MTGRAVRSLGVVLTVGLCAAGCAVAPGAGPDQSPMSAGSTASPEPTATLAMADVPDDSFYQPPAIGSDAKPGTILRLQPLTAPAGVLVWAILYVSTGIDGASAAVSGLLAAPSSTAPADGRPVVAYAHGTTGLADACAPSRSGADENELAAIAAPFVATGDAVVFTDYEGLGTPGPHPYVVGTSEGRAVLDSVRAAQSVGQAGTGTAVGLLGHSQGGHAVLWANQLAATYAPELDVRGVVAAAPAGDLPAIASWLVGPESGQRAWLNAALLTSSWHTVYGLPVEQVLRADDLPLLDALQASCPADVDGPYQQPLMADLANVPDWRAKLDENSPGASGAAAAMLVLQGTADEQIPLASTDLEVARLCAAGDSVDYRVISGADHSDALFAQPQLDIAVGWLGDRFGGIQAQSTCV